jgi:hypothetical protein
VLEEHSGDRMSQAQKQEHNKSRNAFRTGREEVISSISGPLGDQSIKCRDLTTLIGLAAEQSDAQDDRDCD